MSTFLSSLRHALVLFASASLLNSPLALAESPEGSSLADYFYAEPGENSQFIAEEKPEIEEPPFEALPEEPIKESQPPQDASIKNTSPMEAPNPKESNKKATLAELSAQMAQAAFDMNDSPGNLSRLIAALEKLANEKCFGPPERVVRNRKPNSSPACEKALDNVQKLDKANAAAVCITSGFQSAQCLSAYSSQEIVPFQSSSGRVDYRLHEYHVPVKQFQTFSQRIAPTLSRLNDEYRKIRSERPPKELSDEERKAWQEKQGVKLTRVLEQQTALACSLREVYFLPREEKKSSSARESVKADSQEPFSEIDSLLEYGSATKKRAEEIPPQELSRFNRVTLISEQCRRLLKSLSAQAPNSPTLACYQMGLYSPHCALAKGKHSRKGTAENSRRNIRRQHSEPDGLVSF